MRKYYRSIYFTETPLKKKYRYKDIFQIIPIDSEIAPRCPYAHHFPIFLEYYIETSEIDIQTYKPDILDELALQSSIEREIIELLTCLSNHRFIRYENVNFWGILTPAIKFEELEEEARKLYNNQYSSWVVGSYIYPGLFNELQIEKLTETELDDVNKFPYYKYFTQDPVESVDNEITFPETIDICIEKYFNLKPEFQNKIKSAIRLINNGLSVTRTMRSIAFLSYVSSIETMVSIEMDDENIEFCKSCKTLKKSSYICQECNSPIWGIRKKFTEYLKKYVAGSSSSQKKYKKIYDLRSKIAHNGHLFLSDIDNTFVDMEIKNSEWLINLETLQLARLNIVNWIIDPKNKANRQQGV